jgi:hypothetical protein
MSNLPISLDKRRLDLLYLLRLICDKLHITL